mgnify:CR=1 FL=1
MSVALNLFGKGEDSAQLLQDHIAEDDAVFLVDLFQPAQGQAEHHTVGPRPNRWIWSITPL